MDFLILQLLVVALTFAFASQVDNEAGDYDDEEFLVGRKQVSYKSAELSERNFLNYSRLSDTTHLKEATRQICIPRVVGTPGHERVRNYIVESLQALHWTVEVDKFHDTAPILGKLHFHNIIATLNPQAERFLVLACHYDSKYFPDMEFVGATDSAVPCAMLLNLAHVLQQQLEALRTAKVSLMLIFFDGEEAFKEWGPEDSIYGARHLAAKWERESDMLDRIDMLCLLDLIGAPDPKFYSFFANTEAWYSRMLTIEERLSDSGHMEHYASSGISRYYPNRYFQPNAVRSSYVEDDHIPFLRLNVPIMHLITMPFPSVWHTKEDNESAVDYATVENIARILRLFTLEYLLGNDKVVATGA